MSSMTGPVLVCLFVCIALLPRNAAATEPSAPTGRLTGERIEFDSMARQIMERVWGHLSFPSKPQAKYPLMLILHSSGGIHDRDWFFARTLNGMGVAAFVLDSFRPRGLARVYEHKLNFGELEQAIDALTAIETLKTDARIDFSRIGAMGRSLGGQTAVRLSCAALRSKQDWDLFFTGCVKLGMWVGGNPEATQRIDQDWTNAVKRRWLGG